MSKSKRIALRILVICLVIAVAGYILYESKYDGSTVDSRQILLNSAVDDSLDQISIIAEEEVDDYLLTAFKLPDERIGLAVFEPVGRKEYKYQTGHWQFGNKLEFAYSINDKVYMMMFCNSPDAVQAEVKCAETGGGRRVTKILNADECGIFAYEVPFSSYHFEVTYLDSEGNNI